MAEERRSVHVRHRQRDCGGTRAALRDAAGGEKANGRRLQCISCLQQQQQQQHVRLLVLPESCPIVGTASRLTLDKCAFVVVETGLCKNADATVWNFPSPPESRSVHSALADTPPTVHPQTAGPSWYNRLCWSADVSDRSHQHVLLCLCAPTTPSSPVNDINKAAT